MENYTIEKLLDLSYTEFPELFAGKIYPWEALGEIHDFILKAGAALDPEKYWQKDACIWVAKSAQVADTACIHGPVIIGEEAQIRHCAFIRGDVIVGGGSVVGNSTELKNCVLFQNVQTPHYNYVGDSILGHKAHMGAGSICSNVKADKKPVAVKADGKSVETGRKKFGAILGDFAEIGCGSVLNPGTVIGRNSMVYPLTSVRGCVPAESICKQADQIVKKQ